MNQKPRSALQLAYLKRRISAVFTLDGFAVSSLWIQQFVVLLIAIVIVLIFAPLVGSLELSARMFMQTSGVDSLSGWGVLFGVIDFVFGVIAMSFIISLLSSALTQFIEKIKDGTLAYTRSHHWVIINANEMLVDVLAEINDRGNTSGDVYEVVILVHDKPAVARVREQLLGKTFLYLEIFVRHGDLLNRDTYYRINFCRAKGALLLQNSLQADAFIRDNESLKTLFVLAGWSEFKETLRKRHEAISPFKFVVETSGTIGCQQVISKLLTVNGAPLCLAANPREIADRMLSRSIVNVAYYRIFEQLFSFSGHEIYFIDPARFGADVGGRCFRDLCYGFTRGIVVGRSRFRNGVFEVEVGPMDEILSPGNWLIVVADDENALTFDPSRKLVSPGVTQPQPKEIVHRRICMVGDRYSFPSLMAFLDEPSRQIYRDHQIVLSEPMQYLNDELIRQIRSRDFDTVVLNLEEEMAFRLAAYINTLFPADDPFLDKIITVIDNPVTDDILNSGRKNHKTILSQRLCAKYLSQVLFQKSLSIVIEDLCSPEGFEINLMEVGVDIPKSMLKDKHDLKQYLLCSDIIYAGIIDEDKNILFDCDDFSRAQTLIVFSKGEM